MSYPPHPLELGYRPHSRGRVPGNRRRFAWVRPTRRACIAAICVEVIGFLLFYPGFWVRNVQVEGLRTLTASQVTAVARLPVRTNILVMLLREPLAKRIETLPVVDHARCEAILPSTIVLQVAERTPYAVLEAGSGYWLVDRKQIPYQSVAGPVAGMPTIQPTGSAAAEPVQAGQRIASDWMVQSYYLLSLLSNNQTLQPKLITVDQNANLCLNRLDNLKINIGAPDDLPAKLAVAEATLRASGPDVASKVDYIDVTYPSQPAFGLRTSSHEPAHT